MEHLTVYCSHAPPPGERTVYQSGRRGMRMRFIVGLVKPRLHDTTGCQTRCQYGCTTRFDNRLDVCLHVTAGCQTGCITGLTTGCRQPVVSCKRGLRVRARFVILVPCSNRVLLVDTRAICGLHGTEGSQHVFCWSLVTRLWSADNMNCGTQFLSVSLVASNVYTTGSHSVV